MAEFKDRFVLRSTEASRAAGTLSILAVLETLLSTIGMWFLVIYTDWPFLLLSSLVLAFLMLLRSPQSVAMGVERFERYWETEEVSKATAGIVLVVAITLSFAFFWFAPKYWSTDYSGFLLFWHFVIVSYITINVAIMAISIIGISGKSAVGPIGAAEKALRAARAAGLMLGKEAPAILAGSILFSGPGFLGGVYIRTMFIRFWATLFNICRGLMAFPANWRELMVVTDTYTIPEIIPKLPDQHRLNYANFWQARKKTDNIADKLTTVLLLIIFFIPALIYRFYLKSTAWIYLPLIWLAYIPPIERAADGCLVWDKAKGQSALDKILALLAAGGLCLQVYAIADWAGFISASQETVAATGIFSPWLIFRSMNLSTLLGWNGLLAFSTIITLVLYFWSDKIYVHIREHPDFKPPQTTLRFLRGLTNLKTMLTILWVFITFGVMVQFMYHHGELPDLINTWLIGYWGEMKHISP